MELHIYRHISESDIECLKSDFRMPIHLLFDKHEQKADEQECAGSPDRAHAKAWNQPPADACANGKEEDYPEIMHGLHQNLFTAGPEIGAQRFHAASEISDAHGAGKRIAVHFTECLDLHGAGEGHYGVGNQIPGIREKSDREQEQDFNHQDQLSPVDALCLVVTLVNDLCCGNTQGEKGEGNQITNGRRKISVRNMLAEKNDISGLGIGKYISPGKIGICILKAAGHGQKGSGQECFRHLFVRLIAHEMVILSFLNGIMVISG